MKASDTTQPFKYGPLPPASTAKIGPLSTVNFPAMLDRCVSWMEERSDGDAECAEMITFVRAFGSVFAALKEQALCS